MSLPRLVGIKLPPRGAELIPGVLLSCLSAALLWWSVPRLKEVFLEQEKLVPTTHISAGSDCEFGQKNRIEFNVDAKRPTTFVLAFRDIAPPSALHPVNTSTSDFPDASTMRTPMDCPAL